MGFTQSVTEIITRSIQTMFLGSKPRPVRAADNLNAIYELILYTMWDPQHPTTLQASTACYGDSFTLSRRSVLPVRYELDCKYCYK
jgi:hypothetical protein